MSLGDLRHLSYAERCDYYRRVDATPTSDDQANRIPRVQWLEDMSIKHGPFGRVLDIGCNDGFVTRWMVDNPGTEWVFGVDLNAKALELARKAVALREHPERAVYLVMDYRDGVHFDPFDAVVCFELLEHFTREESIGLLRYMQSVLKPGGFAFLNTPNVHGRWGETNPDECHLVLHGLESLQELLWEAIGVAPEFHAYHELGPFLTCWWQR